MLRGKRQRSPSTVDDIYPALPEGPYINYRNYGIFLIMDNAEFVSPNVSTPSAIERGLTSDFPQSSIQPRHYFLEYIHKIRY